MDSPNLVSIRCANETRACRDQSDKNPVNFVEKKASQRRQKNVAHPEGKVNESIQILRLDELNKS